MAEDTKPPEDLSTVAGQTMKHVCVFGRDGLSGPGMHGHHYLVVINVDLKLG